MKFSNLRNPFWVKDLSRSQGGVASGEALIGKDNKNKKGDDPTTVPLS
jgi:hypothetical protein